jgi:muramidase (phage lysozyme)
MFPFVFAGVVAALLTLGAIMEKYVPPSAKILLDFIASYEAPHGYDTVYGNNQRKLTKPITAMSLDELMANQKGFTRAFGSSASGRYQFMRDTLAGLKTELRLTGDEQFTPEFQDWLGYALLKRRGFLKWSTGQMTDQGFALGLAQEWASFPVLQTTLGAKRKVKRGQSFYSGDGLNKALVKPDVVEAHLRSARVAEVADATNKESAR